MTSNAPQVVDSDYTPRLILAAKKSAAHQVLEALRAVELRLAKNLAR